ncbi:hypothetical protein D2962_14275 [Biomaibacter acetigenes]|jgi:hypothetical protein|uniref:Uncharacterized protein n=1 Tax=Biomaibacter acetigenes TaxID=2316383 RepID=A0A3G2R800_9FIRM|nr:hypothetical protein [Biomaibacter acetigenes]AYO31612.1 hypothetical protein D2962_14275 [Biomaibacter acetigenes]MDN5313656.1 hypothetical protein [Thermoanaerobacteraceae bacterium]RKL62976.1 hypothetical protein DXT63_08230 [Thermoanaerobacteraceae bacterium SP2]
MFPILWYVAALVSVPEAFLILAISTRMMKLERSNYNRIFLISVIQGGITLIIRKISMGISQYFLSSFHTVILIATLTLLFSLLCRVKVQHCFIPIFIVTVIYGSIQYIVVLIVLNRLKMPLFILQENPWLDVALFFPVAGITVLVFYLIDRLNLFEGL